MGGFRGPKRRNNLARRNKREPFNPFAPGASAKPQKKTQKHRPDVNKTQLPTLSRQEKMEAMRKKIREQQEKKKVVEESSPKKEIKEPQIEVKTTQKTKEEVKVIEVEKSIPAEKNKENIVKPKTIIEEKKVDNKTDDLKNKKAQKNILNSNNKLKVESETSKLDDLKRRSDALAAKTGVQLPKGDTYKGTLFSTKKTQKKPEKQVNKPKKPVRKTKKGGGKQPKQKKLNRRKQLEFRFDARAILDNSTVAEEHRSNVFGQIWAKGERVGIDSAIEYVSLKQQEGILTEDVSSQLVALIKSYTTKR